MPELWIPGSGGPIPSIEDFVARLGKTIEAFAERRGWDEAFVEVQLHDGVRLALRSIRPEPGYGFLTLCPFPEDEQKPWPGRGEDGDGEGGETPEELIVPIGSIVRITLGRPEEQTGLGFSPPAPA